MEGKTMSGAITTTSAARELKSTRMISPLAGKPAPKQFLLDLTSLEREYFERQPDIADPNQLVSFGKSGHRGSLLSGTFTERHLLAITQPICDYRRSHGVDGPLYIGKDTHALPGHAQRTALEVQTRMNLPGFTDAHRRWRCTEEMLHSSIFRRLRDVTATSNLFFVPQSVPAANTVDGLR
jgi:phosphoglucomutase/phosphomannomutase-like protein